MDPFAPHNHPVNCFSESAWISPARNQALSPALACKQLVGWSRLFEDPSYSPLRWRGDSRWEALNNWSTKELDLLNLKGSEGYSIGLEFRIQLLNLATTNSRDRLIKAGLISDILEPEELPPEYPVTLPDIFKQAIARIESAYPESKQSDKFEVVAYTAPRFCSEEKILGVEALAERLVIDSSMEAPQNGFGYKFSHEDLKVMSWGFSSRLITLESERKVHGFYFIHLAFPSEPTSPGLQEAKVRAIDMNLMGESWNPRSLEKLVFTPGPDDFIGDNQRFAWADLVAISKEARDHFYQTGSHAYSAIHSTMLETCRLYGVGRVFGEVRIGKNENLAWSAHQKLGWKMPFEELQRKKPIVKNGCEYALIYLDL